jgi:hypothetical protein
MGNSAAFAQLFSTSSSNFHSYGGGTTYAPTPTSIGSSIRSTSSFSTTTTISNYSTAPMQIANGSIQTVASSLESLATTDDTGYIPTMPKRSIAPPTEAPLHLDWDAFLLLFSLAVLYILHRYRKSRTTTHIQ